MDRTMDKNPLGSVYAFLWNHARLMATVFVGSALLTYVALWIFATPRYLSQAVIYPANIHPMSSEDPTEQALQVMASTDIKWKIIDSFQLAQHYGFREGHIDYTALSKMFDSRISAERTAYSSILVSVLDKDNALAAQMANALVDLLNKKMLQMRREKHLEWAEIAERKYQDKLATIAKVETEIETLKRENEIVNAEEQSAIIAKKIQAAQDRYSDAVNKIGAFANMGGSYRDSLRKYEVIKKTGEPKIEELVKVRDRLIRAGDRITGLKEYLAFERENLAEYRKDWDEAETGAKRKITYSFVVSPARVADSPSYPKKAIVSFLTAISVLALLALILAIRQQLHLNQQLHDSHSPAASDSQ